MPMMDDDQAAFALAECRDRTLAAVKKEVPGRPVSWLKRGDCLHIFDTLWQEEASLYRQLRSIRDAYQTTTGRTLSLMFHSKENTDKLYPQVRNPVTD